MRLEQQIAELKEVVQSALALAKQQGATGVEVAASTSVGLNVDVRMQAPETVEHFRDKNFAITVYVGQKSGSASTTDTRPESIHKMVTAACQIARHTEADPCGGLPDPESIATTWPDNLSLYHPWDISAEAALEMAMACEVVALKMDPAIVNSEGASVNTSSGVQVYGNSLGFLQEFKHSRHSVSCAVIAEKKGRMQRDSSYTVARDFRDLESIEIIAQKAAQKTVARLDP